MAQPEKTVASADPAPRDEPSEQPELAKILLVDDRQENLVALQAILERPDYELILAHSGEECLAALLRHEDCVVILMDVSMPGMDGFETAHAIRLRKKTRHIPIIFVTAMMGQVEQVFQGYNVGAVDYLIKPVDEHALRAKVEVFVDLWRARREVERTSEALEQAHSRERMFLESLYDVTFAEAPIGIGHAALDGRWIRVNARLARILGREPGDIVKLRIHDMVHPDDRAALLAAIRDVVDGREVRHKGEYRLLDAAGSIVWTALTFALIRDMNAKAVQLTIVEDVTEEKRLSKALEASERRFARLRDSGLIGIFQQRADGTIVEANDAFLAITGYAREDLEAGRLSTSALSRGEPLSGGESDARVAEQLRRSGVCPPYERPFVRKDGSEGIMLIGAVADDGYVGFALDTTALRDAELARGRTVRELAESVRARDDFLALVAHELRTPLTPLLVQVTSMRTIAQTSTAPVEPAWLDRQFEIVDRASMRIAALVEKLVEVSRLTVGQFPIELESTDLAGLVRGVVERGRKHGERAGCDVKVVANASVRGRWDRARIEQVIESLVSNACKFGSQRPVEITVTADEEAAHIAVVDHGVGIAAEDQPRIFARFARLADPRHTGGLGLGLWLSRQIVEAHGGRIEVSSEPGKGATFVVTLPLRETDGAGERPSLASLALAPQPEVLVVDADESSRERLARSLRKAGYVVRTSGGGERAFESIAGARARPGIVLLDVTMPVTTGQHLLERLRADARSRDVPVLLTTAWPNQATSIAGAQGVIGKPVDLPLLLDRIREIVRSADTAKGSEQSAGAAE